MNLFKKVVSYKLNIKNIPFSIPIFTLVLFIIFLFVIISGFFYYLKVAKSKTSYAQDIIEKVGKLIALPSETPSVATVSDPDKLKTGESKAFFKNAEKGDLLLIFDNSKKLILYRPSVNKIIEMANTQLQTAKPTAVKTVTPSPPITGKQSAFRFVILNGTNVSGLAGKMAQELTAKISGAQIVGKDNTIGADYPKSVITDLTGKYSEEVQTIAAKLNILVSNMPPDEVKPSNADFLIIIGKDRTQ